VDKQFARWGSFFLKSNVIPIDSFVFDEPKFSATLDQPAANLVPPKVAGMNRSTVCGMAGAVIVIFLLSSGAYAIFRYLL
jgi:hypothetical protein